MHKKPGYILVLSLMLVSVAVALITSVVQRAISYQRQARLVLDREKARTLALASIQIALAQLSLVIAQEPKKSNETIESAKPVENKDQQEPKQTPQQRWFGQLLPVINVWQQFSFTQEKDGIDGALKLNITCEQGKLGINQLLPLIAAAREEKPMGTMPPTDPKADPKKPAPKPASPQGEAEKRPLSTVLNELVAPAVANGQFFTTVEQLKKQLGRNFEDPTELLQNKSIQAAFQDKLVLTPDKKPDKQTVYLTDLFTIHSGSGRINPWFISNSFGSLLGFTQKDTPRDVKELVKNFKPFMQWQSVWDKLMMPLFGKSYASLPKEITALFSLQFEATAFFVISYATVGGITQRLAALLEKDTVPAELSPSSVIFKITKLYWL